MYQAFELTGEYIALCDLLKYCGVAQTGGAAKHMVAASLVQVDGRLELRKTCKIYHGQRVSGAGFTIEVKER